MEKMFPNQRMLTGIVTIPVQIRWEKRKKVEIFYKEPIGMLKIIEQ